MIDTKLLVVVTLLIAASASVDCLRGFKSGKVEETSSSSRSSAGPAPFKTYYTTQYLDHFNSKDDRTFQQRYLVNDDHWDREFGPVFFYTGNEGDVESFWNNTGFMFEIAPLYRALIIFAEHRYYGKTLPFGEASFNLENIGYLSVQQALADFAKFLADYKANNGLTERNPVISFGGSYGGILTAYMRFKYPNLVQGALAASAPIYLTAGLSKSTLFFEAVTKDFEKEEGCVPLVRQAFDLMEELAKKEDFATLSKEFSLCKPISDPAGYHHLLMWMRNAFTIMAMVDYPYPASFIANLPAWPVHAACTQLVNQTSSGVPILSAFKNLASILYNDGSNCFDIYAQFIECADPTSCGLGNDAKAWDYQACTELDVGQESNGVTDMFPVIRDSFEIRQAYCKKTWDVTIRANWTATQFWGKDVATASNIVFSNGELDPWRMGGVLEDLSDSLKAFIVHDGAHHLDLRGSNPADPQSVKDVRNKEMTEITKWITPSIRKLN